MHVPVKSYPSCFFLFSRLLSLPLLFSIPNHRPQSRPQHSILEYERANRQHLRDPDPRDRCTIPSCKLCGSAA
ncbi:hypothetical protein V8E51_003970 [Hyaloscypha variabilis]